MKIRNNTDITLNIYVGDPVRDEPNFYKGLKPGEDVELPEGAGETISIQK